MRGLCLVTLTTHFHRWANLYVIKNVAKALKTKGCKFDCNVVTGGTKSVLLMPQVTNL